MKLSNLENIEDNDICGVFATLSRSLSVGHFSTQQSGQLLSQVNNGTFHFLGSFFSVRTKVNNYKRLTCSFKDSISIQ